MVKTLASLIWVVLLLSYLTGLTILFSYFSPQELIAYVGVENAYAFLGILAFMSGLSLFVGIPYHLVLMAMAVGGLNPWYLGMVATAGVIAGDSVSYIIGYHGRALVPRFLDGAFSRVSVFLVRHPKLTPAFFFVYGSLAPFSNDFVGVLSGLLRYPWWRVIVPLGLGNLVFNTAIAFMVVSSMTGGGWLHGLF